MNLDEWLTFPAIGWGYYGIYAGISLLYSLLLTLFFPARFRKTFVLNYILMAAISVSLFILGIFISTAMFIALHSIKPVKKRKSYYYSSEIPDYQRAPKFQPFFLGESSGALMLKKEATSISIRERILVAINQYSSSKVNKLNKALLNDDIDEVRLYAQALIEKQERVLFKLLGTFNHALQKTDHPYEQAFLKKMISQLLWEQIHKDLIDKASIPITLQKIQLYAEEAFFFLKNDSFLPLLMVMVELKKNNIDEAKRWLHISEVNQNAYYRVAVYKAEIAFKEKQFDVVGKTLKTLMNKQVIGADSVIQFWSHS